MLRLFIRLYSFIIVALLVITALLDRVLLPEYHKPSEAQTAVIELAQRALNQSPKDIPQIIEALPWPAQIIERSSIVLHDSYRLQLDENGYFVSYSDDHIQHIYIAAQDTLLQMDVTSSSEEENVTFYLVLMFILFAVALGFWLLPLWRELLQVKYASESFRETGKLPPIKTSARTTLSPILNSVNDLGRRIDQLLQNQQALSGTLAHELRTPLARLKFRLELLPESQHQLKSDIEADIDGMNHLLQHLLDYTKLQAVNPELNMGDIPIKMLIEETVQDCMQQYNRDIEVHLNLDEVKLIADGVLVERAITNLISNAIKYATTAIFIDVSQNNDDIIIRVMDDGNGVPADEQAEIFQPFVQYPKHAKTHQNTGAGIGLALVTLIQRWHGGSVRYESRAEGGSSFILTYRQQVATQ